MCFVEVSAHVRPSAFCAQLGTRVDYTLLEKANVLSHRFLFLYSSIRQRWRRTRFGLHWTMSGSECATMYSTTSSTNSPLRQSVCDAYLYVTIFFSSFSILSFTCATFLYIYTIYYFRKSGGLRSQRKTKQTCKRTESARAENSAESR